MRPVPPFLRGTTGPLSEVYDVALLDLDGVVYIGTEPVPRAAEILAAARHAGMRLAFVTNNAARTPQAVAERLNGLGVRASPAEVVTSAQAAAHYLADRLSAQARVLVVGTTGLEQALRERGLVPVADANGQVDAVAQGYSADLTWKLLAEGAVAINRGALWVATNVDSTIPSPRGPLPGNGSLVAALKHATGAEPVVTGKPDPAMHRESVQRSGARRPIVVGDRLDTDIEGANTVGCDSLLVMSGVTSAADLLAAPVVQRPTFIAADLGGLLVRHEQPAIDDDGAVCGAWRVAPDGSGEPLVLHAQDCSPANEPATSAEVVDDLDALRAMCAALWRSDEAGATETAEPAQVRRRRENVVRVVPGGAATQSRRAAQDALDRLGLS